MNKTTVLLFFIFMTATIQTISSQNFPNEHWKKIQSPTFSGWDENKLDELREYIIDSTAITGIMIIHEGKVVLEYGNVSENSYIASCRKSIMAMLYGKYVKDGTIDLDQSLEDLHIDLDGILLENEKKATVRDIISARSGVFLPSANGGDMIHLAPERGSVQPGTFWLYNNWDFNMAGHIFEKETKKNIYDEIESQFAIPLQMQDWDRSIQEKSGDQVATDILAYHMWFSTRDMARLGVLMLNNGMWNNTQVIDKNWVREMTTPKSTFDELDAIAPFLKNDGSRYSYGYMWWLWKKPENKMLDGAYTASGAWGQNITVFPKMNTVLAIKTNDTYERQKGNQNYIIDQLTKIYDPESYKNLQPLASSLEKNNVPQFIKDFKAAKQHNTIDYQKVLNTMGYIYLNDKQYSNAIDIFELNVQQHPTAWNVFDSLGEAYFLSGDYTNALKNFKKSVELNSQNQYNNNDRLAFIIKRIELKK